MARFTSPVFQALSRIGTPLPGAKLFVFETGTTTLKDLFQDDAETIPQANPVVANGSGVFPLFFFSGTTKQRLESSRGILQWERDPVKELAEEDTLDQLIVILQDFIKTYNNVQAVKDDTALVSGQIVQTKGYFTSSVNDVDGNARYKIMSSAEFGGTPDEQGDFTLNNGLIAKFMPVGKRLFVEQYGAVGNGSTDDTNAIKAAMASASGKTVIFDSNSSYLITSSIDFADELFVDLNGSTILFNSGSTGRLFQMSNFRNFRLINGKIDASGTAVSEELIRMDDSINGLIDNVEFLSPTADLFGSIRVGSNSQKNRIINCKFNDSRGSAIELRDTCSENQILNCFFTNSVLFGIKVTVEAHNNTISRCSCTQNQIELIGLTNSVYENVISDNIALNCGDNGISISGLRNTVTGNICANNDKAGIWIWGSFNSVTGNACFNNNGIDDLWAGIGASANFGGAGQFNMISGNVCDDRRPSPVQFNSFRIAGSVYQNWAQGLSINSGDYIVNGLNIYQATTSGTTGAIPPTHTSGTVSDGGVDWRWTNEFLLEADSIGNTLSTNRAGRSQNVPYTDTSTDWKKNTLLAQERTSFLTNDDEMRLGTQSGDNNLFVMLDEVDRARFTTTEFRPETDQGLSLGLSNRRWSNIYGRILRPGDGNVLWLQGSASPEGVVTAPIGSLFTRDDGGANTTLYVKESGAGNTGWVAK